jgi:hypothetical protein
VQQYPWSARRIAKEDTPMISRIVPTLCRLVLLLALAACGSGGGGGNWVTPTPAAGGDGEKIHIIGVVRHHEVEAEARRLDNAMGIHQVGTMVELVRIRSRE